MEKIKEKLISHHILLLLRRFPRRLSNVSNNFSTCFADSMKEKNLKHCQNQVGFDKQILSYIYVCLLPSEISLQLKNLSKKYLQV